jgi:hypothetical protein
MPKFKFATDKNGGKPFDTFIRDRYEEKLKALEFEYFPGDKGPTDYTVTYRKMTEKGPLDIMFSGYSSASRSHSVAVRRLEDREKDMTGRVGCWAFHQLDDALEVELDDFIEFGNFCRRKMELQSQYGSRYIDGRIPGYPNLGKGLRFKGSTSDYHFVKIHRDDREEFLRRYQEYCQDRGNLSFTDLAKKYEIQKED